MQLIEAKVVVLGSQAVGKTSVTIRYVDKKFNKKEAPTIGASFFTSKIIAGDFKVKLQIWDTAGQERFKSMAPMFYRNSNAAIIVFDLTREFTFKDVHYWVTEIRRNIEEHVVLCIVGNKCDLEDERQISYADAYNYAQSIDADYMETSALNDIGINEVFNRVGETIAERWNDMIRINKSRKSFIEAPIENNEKEEKKSKFACC